jgi:hypothetical protein
VRAARTGGAEPVEAGRDGGAQVDAQRPVPALGEHLQIAPRLCGLDDAERVPLSGHREIGLVVAGELEDDTTVRATLIRLAGRVQEPRPEADAGRRLRPVELGRQLARGDPKDAQRR